MCDGIPPSSNGVIRSEVLLHSAAQTLVLQPPFEVPWTRHHIQLTAEQLRGKQITGVGCICLVSSTSPRRAERGGCSNECSPHALTPAASGTHKLEPFCALLGEAVEVGYPLVLDFVSQVSRTSLCPDDTHPYSNTVLQRHNLSLRLDGHLSKPHKRLSQVLKSIQNGVISKVCSSVAECSNPLQASNLFTQLCSVHDSASLWPPIQAFSFNSHNSSNCLQRSETLFFDRQRDSHIGMPHAALLTHSTAILVSVSDFDIVYLSPPVQAPSV